MNADRLFELFITYIQVVIWVWFISSCFGFKYKKLYNAIGFLISSSVIFVEIAFINHFVAYDGFLAIILVLTMILYARIMLNGDWFMQSFMSVFSLAIIFIVASLTIFYICYFSGKQASDVIIGLSKERVCIAFICRILELVLFKIILYIKKEYIISNKEWILFIVSALMTWCATVFITKAALGDEHFMLNLICIATIIILINFMIYYFMLKINKANKDHLEYKLIKMQYDNIKENAENTKVLYENISAVRHDMRNQLLAIQTLAQNEQNKEIVDYINTITDDIFSVSQKIVFTDNEIFNAIINSRLENCRKHKITVSINIEDDIVKNIQTDVITIVISNVFDNAIEAAQMCENKFIIFNVRAQGKYISIYTENTYDPKYSNINLESSKSNKAEHGFGTKNISKTVEKYNGMFKTFVNKTGMFCCDILIDTDQ